MVRISLGKAAPILPRSTPTSAFFSPSYRALSRSNSLATTATTDAVSTIRRCSFSSGAGGSSSRAGSGGPRLKPAATAASSASNSAHKATTVATTATRSPATSSTTPHAPTVPHATPQLVGLDSFFSLHRPLLELPIRLTQRRSTNQAPALYSHNLSTEVSTSEVQDISQKLDGLDLGEGEQLVVDLAEDGETAVGEAYVIRLDGSKRIEALRSPEEERETELREQQEAAEEEEAALEELEQHNTDPYDAWLIGEPEGTDHATPVARYLASHPPFMAPSAPAPVQPAPPAAVSSQTAADLSFLRPHTQATLTPIPSAFAPIFASQLANPLTPSGAKQQADRFLSAASLSHRSHSSHDYVQRVSEPLEVARRSYAGLSSVGRRRFDQQRQRGEVRFWNEQEGWTTVHLGRSGSGSPFLPAEMVDLDWEDEHGQVVASGEVALDSTKRKRKKKITKHKYKKRRKAQRALRQRLGK